MSRESAARFFLNMVGKLVGCAHRTQTVEQFIPNKTRESCAEQIVHPGVDLLLDLLLCGSLDGRRGGIAGMSNESAAGFFFDAIGETDVGFFDVHGRLRGAIVLRNSRK